MESPVCTSQTFDISWTHNRQGLSCGSCQHSFLLPRQQSLEQCPLCGQADLSTWLPSEEAAFALYPPEAISLIQAPEAKLQPLLADFVKDSLFPPKDLTAENLNHRLQLLYLPIWWVDVPVAGNWRAEMGFDYQVVSHAEKLVGNRWVTNEKRETRTRWDIRKGRLKRSYDNIAAPALEAWSVISDRLGEFSEGPSAPFSQEALLDALLVLPQRPPEDAWGDVYVPLRSIAATECQHASQAQHHRGFGWDAEAGTTNWTQHLVPVFGSWYRDETGRVQSILIHGHTGKLAGNRQASLSKAQKQRNLFLLLGILLLGLAGLSLWGNLLNEDISQVLGMLGGFGGLALCMLGLSQLPKARAYNDSNARDAIFGRNNMSS